MSRVVVLLLCCALLVAGCRGRPEEQIPPFKRAHALNFSQEFYRIYAQDEEEAEKEFKGKVVVLVSCTDPRHPLIDESGEKYVTGVRHDAGDAPSDWSAALRCYIYRPDDPMTEGEWGEGWTAIGVCMGKSNGIIVLRNCSFRRWIVESADW